jgi:hypothetical protein
MLSRDAEFLGNITKTPWLESACELYRPTERPPLVGEVSTDLADRGCRVISATIPPQSLISVF